MIMILLQVKFIIVEAQFYRSKMLMFSSRESQNTKKYCTIPGIWAGIPTWAGFQQSRILGLSQRIPMEGFSSFDG